MKKRIRVVLPIVVIAALATWAVLRGTAPEGDALSASGTVEATDADLGFQAGGRVAEVLAQEGDRVEAGATLARLESGEVEAALRAARASVDAAAARLAELRSGARPQEIATAEAVLRSAEERWADAGRDVERARDLHEGGAISREALDKALTSLEVAEAASDQAAENLALIREGPRAETIRSQEALLEQARANLASTEAILANRTIVAPFAGLVTIRHRQPGESVGPGAPVLTLLDPDDRWVRIYVRGDRLGRVDIGQAAEIVSDTYPDRTYAGEVVFIGAEAEFTPRNVQTAEERTQLVYPVKVRITDDAEFRLKPGTPADVLLIEGAR